MDLLSRYHHALATLREHRQDHLLAFWPDLDDAGRARLLDDIERIDFEQVAKLIDSHVLREPPLSLPSDIAPPDILPNEPAGAKQKQQYAAARARGEQLIRAGKVACLTVAGGQGTRLGFDGPKGALPISPIRNKPLFQLFAEQIRNAGNLYGAGVPWLIMTSPTNDYATKAFLEANKFFGLCREQVVFFTQGVMPAISVDGRVLLESKDRVAVSPDGHGGTLRAIYRSGALERLQQAGVTVLSYFQVDNPLIHPVDPLFIGLHDQARSQISSKTIPKAGPVEKVGNFCKSAGLPPRLMVIEYSDLPEKLAYATDATGRRLFDAGSIAIHLFDVDFIATLNRGGFALPFHRAVKKVPHIDAAGKPVQPDKPNAVKLETFVFDSLPLAERTLLLATRRDEEFAPAKNASGADSVATARAAMIARAARWLEAAGVAIPRQADGTPDATIEISPLLADSAEQLGGAILASDVRVPPGGLLYLGAATEL
ncbi:MAG: UDPGP type 1 family protein [Phycisphaerae bacterium]|nr:UDPGP type 1 family protein [Phycisphaerae bacterium]